MPVITDATVVDQPYQTSASARPQMLSNGWIVTTNHDSAGKIIYLQVDRGDGLGFVPLCYIANVYANGFSVVHKGTFVYVLFSGTPASVNSVYFNAITQTNEDIFSISAAADTAQTSIQSINAIISSNEISVTLSSKNNNYLSSFNPRYIKGVISEIDGSVTWSSAEQVGKFVNSDINLINPKLCLDSEGIPCIFVEYVNAGNNGIYFIKRNKDLGSSGSFDSLWSFKVVYNGYSFLQGSPSSIFVPSKINGLLNGRIWVAWQGQDGVYPDYNIRVSYSDDGGITWSAMNRITSDGKRKINSTMTANHLNEIFIFFENVTSDGANMRGIYLIKNISDKFSDADRIISGGVRFPSVLFDIGYSLRFTGPLYIYQNNDNDSVRFSGAWTETHISPIPMSLGIKDKPNNLLTYAITTDDVLSPITEKLNGVVINTHESPLSGEEFTVDLTQEQWDSITYGRFNRSKNLLPPFRSWIKKYPDSNVVEIIGDYEIELIKLANSGEHFNYVVNNLEVGQDYIFSTYSHQLGASFSIKDGTSGIGLGISNTGPIKFTAISKTVRVTFVWSSGNVGLIVKNMQLEKGLIPTQFEEMIPDNTLTIEMGNNEWSYTFDKRLAAEDDLLTAVKALQDTDKVFLPAVKQMLTGTIVGKGGTVPDDPLWADIDEAIRQISTGKKATGHAIPNSSVITVNNLNFRPDLVILVKNINIIDNNQFICGLYDNDIFGGVSGLRAFKVAGNSTTSGFNNMSLNSNGFVMDTPDNAAVGYHYYAIKL